MTEVTGVSDAQIVVVAENLARKETGCIVFGHNVFTHERGDEAVACLANLALLTGKLGRKDCGLIPIIAKNNCQGMLDMGVTPDLLPGYQSLENRAPFEKAWGKPLPEQPGKTAEELLTAVEQGTIKALHIMGCDPLVDFPEPKRWAQALEKLEWLAVQDVFSTETAARAHYVFPAVTFAEKAGTFTSGERRVQKFDVAIEPFRNALPDWEIIQKLSQHMGYPLNYTHPSQVMKEISSLVPQYNDIGYEKLDRHGIQWPLRDNVDSPHIPLERLRLAFKSFALPEPQELKSGKFLLVTGPAFFHSGTLSTYAQGLNVLGESAWVEIHERDAARLNLKEGDAAKISSSEYSISAPLKITSAVPHGTAFIPHHFRDAKVNGLIARSNYCQVDIVKG
jgi:predicted molibdopterin-dependent oxidoreductase YjgC